MSNSPPLPADALHQQQPGLVPDIDVYDSAAWCSPVPLSVTSLNRNGLPVEVPDFTRGRWAELRLGLDSRETDMPALAPTARVA